MDIKMIEAIENLFGFESCIKEEYNHSSSEISWEETKQALQSAIDLMQDRLKWEKAGIVPEERHTSKECPQPYSQAYDTLIPEIKGFNACRSEVLMRMMGMEEKITKILLDTCKKELFENIGFMLTNNEVQLFAHAIVEMLQKGE